MNPLKLWTEARQWVSETLFEPNLTKSLAIGGTGLWFWMFIKTLLGGVILVGSALLISIHVWVALARIWCPARRRRLALKDSSACPTCPLCGQFLCPYGLSEKD